MDQLRSEKVARASGSPTWRRFAGGLLVVLAFAPLAMAETFTVTKTEDDDGPCAPDDCALREAVIAANALDGADRIVLSSGVYTLTINGTGDESASMTGDLDILDDLEVVGDPSGRTVIEAQVDDRVMEIGFSVVTFSNVRITGGYRTGGGTSTLGGCIRMLLSDVTFLDSSITDCYCQFEGGGIAIQAASASLINSTLSGNESGAWGGAIYHFGSEAADGLTLINTTVSGNRAAVIGGGIYRGHEGEALISHSTIAYNEAPSGDALYLDFPVRPTWIENSIIEGKCRGRLPSPRGVNVAGPDVDDHCFLFNTDGNLIVEDLGLAPLSSNDGRTPTHDLYPHSPAIGTADPAYCEATDQRGVPRPQGAACDVGAVEAVSTSPIDVPVLGPWGLAALSLLLASAAFRALPGRR